MLLAIFAAANLPSNALAQDFIQPGEELTYEVSFMGVKLGSIKMVTEGYETFEGQKVIKAKSFINSYKGIPFVDLQVVFQSWMSPSIKYSYQFASNTKDGDSWKYEQILFDHKQNQIEIKEYKDKELINGNKIYTTKKWNDGLSLFYLARALLNIKKNVIIPTLMDKDTVKTSINFSGKKEDVNIDAVSYPVRTVYFKGNANWTGVYGMTGEFEGWFSDDLAKVPIKAKLKVYVGSVDIELKHWKRKDWGPPK